MKYTVLATDYDETLADLGSVSATVLESLRHLKASGRKLLLVTGRELPDLLDVFPEIGLFDLVVAENGALLYDPATKKETLLANAPPDAFFRTLQEHGVASLSRGRVIVATRQPEEHKVLDVVRELGLELTLSFNKGGVMVLPSGVNKATGLSAALTVMNVSAAQVVGVGDGENDELFLRACGFPVAVTNAIPILKQTAKWVTSLPSGEGVRELITKLLTENL